MELTKKHKIIIGSGLALIAGFFLIKKSQASAADKAKLANNTPTPIATPTPNGKSTVPSVTILYAVVTKYTYEGKPLYELYNNKFTTGIGFLADGKEITTENAMVDSNGGWNYIKRTSELPYPFGLSEVDGLVQRVYERLADRQISDYPSYVGVGFLENGSLVIERLNGSTFETYLVSITPLKQ